MCQHDRLWLLCNVPQLTEAAAYVLAYELLFGQGCRQHGPAEKAVASSKVCCLRFCQPRLGLIA